MLLSTKVGRCLSARVLAGLGVFTLLAVHSLSQEAPRVDPEVRAALDGAMALRVELAADLLFALIDSEKLPGDLAVDYLERLFHRATEARRQFPMVPAPRKGASGDRAAQLSWMLSGLNLDSMGIRIRSLKRIAKHSPRVVGQLSSYLAHQSPSVDITCREVEVPVSGTYYPGSYEILLQLFPDEVEFILSQVSTPQEAATLIEALPHLDRTSVPYAIQTVIQALNCPSCSDRVFTTTELQLKLGERIEEALASGVVPAELEVALAKAYLGYVARQLRRERCPDVRTPDNEDLIEKFTVPLAERLAEKHKIAPIDVSRLEARYSQDPPGSFAPIRDLESGLAIFELAIKLRQDGSSELRAVLRAKVEGYAGESLEKSQAPFDDVSRAMILSSVATVLGEDDAGNTLIEQLFRVVEYPKSKHRDPAAWILSARMILNLSKSPNAILAKRVRTRLTQSTDSDLYAYYSVDRLLGGLVSEYEADPQTRLDGLLGKY